jgi:cob(I)alamin adenosyltransferase
VKIYTKTGDKGETALYGAGRVRKDHPRVEAMGAVDELNAALGWASAEILGSSNRGRIQAIQHDLFSIGAEIATPIVEDGKRPTIPEISRDNVDYLEKWIDELTDELPALRAFILPGGSPGAAILHLARTICRRAEREVVGLAQDEAIRPEVLIYLNRLSDLLFTLARHENQRAGVGEVEWRKM